MRADVGISNLPRVSVEHEADPPVGIVKSDPVFRRIFGKRHEEF